MNHRIFSVGLFIGVLISCDTESPTVASVPGVEVSSTTDPIQIEVTEYSQETELSAEGGYDGFDRPEAYRTRTFIEDFTPSSAELHFSEGDDPYGLGVPPNDVRRDFLDMNAPAFHIYSESGAEITPPATRPHLFVTIDTAEVLYQATGAEIDVISRSEHVASSNGPRRGAPPPPPPALSRTFPTAASGAALLAHLRGRSGARERALPGGRTEFTLGKTTLVYDPAFHAIGEVRTEIGEEVFHTIHTYERRGGVLTLVNTTTRSSGPTSSTPTLQVRSRLLENN